MKIKHVTPIDNCKLIIEFEGGILRQFPKKSLRDTDISFLLFPKKLQSYVQHADSLSWMPIDKEQLWDGKNIWAGEATLSASELWDMSDEISLQDAQSKLLAIAMQNQAPTEQDKKHHVYFVSIKPLNPEEWIILGESIGGGFAERGGGISLSRSSLREFDNWENHCVLAGGDWIIPILQKVKETDADIINDIIAHYRQFLLQARSNNSM